MNLVEQFLNAFEIIKKRRDAFTEIIRAAKIARTLLLGHVF